MRPGFECYHQGIAEDRQAVETQAGHIPDIQMSAYDSQVCHSEEMVEYHSLTL
jgi:hypothetical protein